ncbi:MAG: BadF/BadG/BcrA/BcrD ATPase family protein [Planctomycetaceae bacterium]
MTQPLVIGVDAGGTKTVALLSPLSGTKTDRPLGTGQGGPGNLRAIGFNAATREIAAAIDAAFVDADIVPHQVAALCLSVAGAGRLAKQQQLHTWAEAQSLAERTIVTTDAEPILAAASDEGIGIALISGTGSLAWGKNSAGKVQRVGGWGHLFGDEGSGYAIALAGLRAVAQTADGIGKPTALTDVFLDRLNAATPSDLVECIYGTTLSRDQIAAMADLVFDVADHDATARGILDSAATDLANMVRTLAQKLQFGPDPFPLAVAGGVLIHQADFRTAVATRIGLPHSRVIPVKIPAVGAVGIARLLASS